MFKKLFPNTIIRRLTYVFAIIFFIALLFFLLRGPYLSNSIKRIILPVLEKATGERIIINSAVINLFPFYLQTKGLKVFDKEGNRLLWITKTRAYIDVLGLFSKEIRIRRLTVKEPDLTVDKKKLDKIIGVAERYNKEDNGKKFGVSLKSAKITDGNFSLSDTEKQTRVSGNGLNMEIVVKDSVNAEFLLKDGTLVLKGLPEMRAGLEGKIKADGKKVEILEAKIFSSDSTLEAKGELYPSSAGGVDHGSFSGKARIFMETISNIFGLKQAKAGELSFSGSVDLVPAKGSNPGKKGPKFKLDLKTKGWFYLETLMELLKVDENVTGRVSLDGRIYGIYPDVTGEGMVEVEDALLDTLSLNDIKGKINYKDNLFSLDDFVAHTYGGELRGNAFLLIPAGDYFVDASVTNVNSPQFFEFIGWEPPFRAGKIKGEFKLSKIPRRQIALVAEAAYQNTTENTENQILDRLRNIKADVDLQGGILTFSNTVFYTSASELLLDGTVDLNQKKLNLNLEMESRDASDLTSPYFGGLSAPVKFTGTAEGSSATPEISGSLEIGAGAVNGERFTKASGDLTYSPDSLLVKLLRVEQEESIYDVSGSIDFRKSKGLFSFNDPYFKAEAVMKNADIKSLMNAVYEDMPLTGIVNGKLFFEGDTREFKGKGNIAIENGEAFGQQVDRALIEAELSPEKISFSSAEIYKDDSKLKASGSVYFDERFDALISSDSINLKDLEILGEYPVDANFSLDAKGSGTFNNPDVKFSLNISESYFRKALIGKGSIKGELKDKRLTAKGDFLEGIAAVDASVLFSDALPWEMSMEFKKGRYDFLLAGFLEDTPRDISASVEGIVRLRGERKKLSMYSKFSSLSFSLYGYNFKNMEDIVLELGKDTLKVKSFSIRGGNGSLKASGAVKIGHHYDLKIDGNVNLTPLMALTKKIQSLKGQGSFAVLISGPWESPELRGKLNIRNGTVMLAGLPYSIGPVNGDIFFDKQRINFDSFSTDFANGRVIVSGVGYLEGLSLERLILTAEMEGISIRPAEGTNIAFGGKVFFETSPKKQSLLGEIKIKKAKYTKRVEWKSELIKLKRVQKPPVEPSSFIGKTELNLHISGLENILIDNNIAMTPVEVDLNVQGTVSQYGLIGRIEAKGGKIFFRGNEFEIIDGRVDFFDPNMIDPVFHILAETYTRGYRVRLNLDGPADKFELTLFSDPPLTDMDILTLLTGGTVSKESGGLESGIGAGEATALFTGGLQDVIERRIKTITGLERFEIDPHTTVTGAVSPKITVGKRLLEEKLFATYSTSVGSTELDVIKLQYNINRNFAIIGLRDEIGSVGADFKFRFEFK